jgi:DNA (cytosine-5)-methyltransferase 1
MALKAISLFSGVGGLDFGFEAAGFKTVAAVEFDRDCSWNLALNRPRWNVICDDINAVPTGDILSSAGIGPGQADILIGGPPCQPFSKSGYWATGDSARLEDPRASTLVAYLRVLRESKPRAFLIENVEGLGFKGKDEGLRFIFSALDDINREQGANYRATVRVVNAADHGVPQLRRRLIIVGARDGTAFQFPRPTHSETLEGVRAPMAHMTSWDALHDAPTVNIDLSMTGKWADLLPTIPEGENYLWHTPRGGGLPLFGWRRRFWNFLLKTAKDRPSWTLQAQPGPATGPFHWDNRRFSPQEMMRLQTFPRNISIEGSLSVAQRLIGNAVPSLMAEIIAREIGVQIFNRPGFATEPTLRVERAPTEAPPPKRPRRVPSKYLHLVGEHSPHPGTGRGSSAALRVEAALV